MQLVILAAGHGRRFGGLKQLAPIGPNGEAIMDYTAATAARCQFEGIVVVVREEIREEIERHVAKKWTRAVPVEFVCQTTRPGTAQAVLAAEPVIAGPFAVANADDIYGEDALGALTHHFLPVGGTTPLTNAEAAREKVTQRHLLVAYRLDHTVFSPDAVKRGVCVVGEHGVLEAIVEHSVRRRDDGSFLAALFDRASGEPTKFDDAQVLGGDTPVSMNLWGFHPRIFTHLREALGAYNPLISEGYELLLPDVVGQLVASNTDAVQVVSTTARCVGITHLEDVAIVRAELGLSDTDDIAVHTARGR